MDLVGHTKRDSFGYYSKLSFSIRVLANPEKLGDAGKVNLLLTFCQLSGDLKANSLYFLLPLFAINFANPTRFGITANEQLSRI